MTVVEVVEAVPKDDQGVQADQDDSNHDGSGRQEHFSQVLGLSISRKLGRPVCQEVASETWCRSEEQSTTQITLFCHNFGFDVIHALLGKIWK